MIEETLGEPYDPVAAPSVPPSADDDPEAAEARRKLGELSRRRREW